MLREQVLPSDRSISVLTKATLLIGLSIQYKLHDKIKVTNKERIGVSLIIYRTSRLFRLLEVIVAPNIGKPQTLGTY